MKIEKIHEIELATEERILASAFSNKNEVVVLLDSGHVYRYNITNNTDEHLFSTQSSIGYSDGGFDLESPITIYTMDSIVVVVNDYKRHGFVHYPGKYNALHLWREDYHADISQFPIALFKDKENVPHLIYSEAWNHIQIMNLDTRQVLTAAKSLIEEGAEEHHIEFYKNHEESNKLPWPSTYDYFFGRLEMSPNHEHFFSAGWAWGSCDAYNLFEVDHFINSNRIKDKSIDGWEHNDRTGCWITNETVAIAICPVQDDQEGATKDSPHEIHIYNVSGETCEIEKKVQLKGINLFQATLYYNPNLALFICQSEEDGTSLITLEGEILLQDKTITSGSYDPQLNLFLRSTGNKLTVDTVIK